MGFERLEPCVGKLASTVLMGGPRSNTGCLPGREPFYKKASDLIYDQDFLLDTLCDNYDVFFKHYARKIGELGETKSQILNQITDLLLLERRGKCSYFA
jgi:hypothetical protein